MITRLNSYCCLLIALVPGLFFGAYAQDAITLSDGAVIEYYLATPGSESDQPWPLAIFMGGGSGNKPISYEAYRFAGRELAAKGWVVAVPVSPDNRSFRGDNIVKVRELIATLQQRDDVQKGKTLLGGISNGGISALEIARRYPQDYLGVMAVPAVVRNTNELESLAGMPVYLRIGGDDQLGWALQFDATVAALREAGTKLNADIIEGAPHMFAMDWSTLEPWLASLLPE